MLRVSFRGCSILCLLLAIGATFLVGCTTTSSDTSHSPTPGPTGGLLATATPVPPPVGWSQVLPGKRFIGPSGETGLVASGAKPGRLAGCALPAGLYTRANPSFVISDDAGRTWQTRNIPSAEPMDTCLLLADTQEPDTFALGSGDASELRVTKDAGHTWFRLAAPSGQVIPIVSGRLALVAGHLIAMIHPDGAGQWHLAEVSLDTGSWQVLDARLPGVRPEDSQAGHTSPLLAFEVDPSTPTTIYAATMITDVVTLFATRDAGQSWHKVLELPSAKRVAVWTATGHRVFMEQLEGKDTEYQFFSSLDGGATWQGIGLHARGGGEQIYIGPQGRIVTLELIS